MPKPSKDKWSSFCDPYIYSNDRWPRRAVTQIDTITAQQTTPRERAVGIVIGSGGLPYIFGHIAVGQLYVLDLNDEVVNSTLHRSKSIGAYEDWDEYTRAMYAERAEYDQLLLAQEVDRASRAKLMGDYALTKAGIMRTELQGIVGDVRQTIPALAEHLRDEHNLVTFVNATSAANHMMGFWKSIFSSRHQRMRVMGAIIGELPIAPDATLVDSSNFLLVPQIYTAATYPGLTIS